MICTHFLLESFVLFILNFCAKIFQKSVKNARCSSWKNFVKTFVKKFFKILCYACWRVDRYCRCPTAQLVSPTFVPTKAFPWPLSIWAWVKCDSVNLDQTACIVRTLIRRHKTLASEAIALSNYRAVRSLTVTVTIFCWHNFKAPQTYVEVWHGPFCLLPVQLGPVSGPVRNIIHWSQQNKRL